MVLKKNNHLGIRRGISSLIVAVILLPVVFGVLAYSVYNLRTQYVTYSNLLASQEYRALSHAESIEGTIKTSANIINLKMKNTGLSTSIVEYIVVKANFTTGSSILFVINLTSTTFSVADPIKQINVTGTIQQGKGLVLPPGAESRIEIQFDYDLEHAEAGGVTQYGTYIQFKPPVTTAASSLSTTLIMFTVPSLTDLQTRSDVQVVNSSEVLAPGSPEDPGYGMTVASSDSGLWCLYKEYKDADMVGTVSYTVAAVGFSGGWSLTREGPPMYSILFSTDYLYNSNLVIKNSTSVTDLSSLLDKYVAVRVISYEYTGYISINGSDNTNNPADVVGIKLYGQDQNPGDKLQLNGTASKVYVYVRESSCGSSDSVSYTPYLVLGDFDNNGYTELLFITEDGYYSYYGYDGDTLYNLDLNDYSKIPLTLLFTGYPIDSNKYVAVEITVRYYFHDNIGGDEQANDYDSWILNIGLYDPENKTLTSYYTLRYQYLTKLEDTYPPSWNYQIDTIQLLVPQTGKTYYVALQFRDPFPAQQYDDMGDIMVGVEYLSIVLMQQQS